jgi:hypothetical protein
MTRSRWAEEHEEHEHFHGVAVLARSGEVDYWLCECGHVQYAPADPTPESGKQGGGDG